MRKIKNNVLEHNLRKTVLYPQNVQVLVGVCDLAFSSSLEEPLKIEKN